MPTTNYYVIKGTSNKIYTSLYAGEKVDSQVFDIWLQALSKHLKKEPLEKLPDEYHILENFVIAQYAYTDIDTKAGFPSGAVYGSLLFLNKAKEEKQ